MTSAVRGRTTKSESFQRLKESALALFSSRGYDGTSLRDIANGADVPLSLINRYFGRKEQLFHEIQSKIWRSLNRERDDALAKARGTMHRNPDLDEIIRIFARPVVALAFASAEGRAAIRLIRERRAFIVHHDLDLRIEWNTARQLWMGLLVAACPELSRTHAVWAFSFVIDTVYSSHLLDDWLDDIMPKSPCLSVDEVTELIVTFCTAGIRALALKCMNH
ncbi:TetR/AcrR family transcriptional regulator [Croceicoccus mobilis]|uniref:HTH tetR-type domain-containing protein n=1 Tax=Croceicoccus mobilis TaxID=1703339 RepID=A0A916Z522_9SPHN|nr:TetR/AcrR family transcriptional regulator [Croceicoccus mobilis]GGD77138.1 hypothetical protein GCM10010990_28560 [Croceicoccus mobilis]